MTGIDFKSQIKMDVEPTDDKHVIRLIDVKNLMQSVLNANSSKFATAENYDLLRELIESVARNKIVVDPDSPYTDLNDVAQPKQNRLYFIGASYPYTVYMFFNDKWKEIGTTEIDISQFVKRREMGTKNGVATLDENGRIPFNHLTLTPDLQNPLIINRWEDLSNLEHNIKQPGIHVIRGSSSYPIPVNTAYAPNLREITAILTVFPPYEEYYDATEDMKYFSEAMSGKLQVLGTNTHWVRSIDFDVALWYERLESGDETHEYLSIGVLGASAVLGRNINFESNSSFAIEGDPGDTFFAAVNSVIGTGTFTRNARRLSLGLNGQNISNYNNMTQPGSYLVSRSANPAESPLSQLSGELARALHVTRLGSSGTWGIIQELEIIALNGFETWKRARFGSRGNWTDWKII